jgi:hypothetical protein
MAKIEIKRPAPNYTIVKVGELTTWFSYDTLVGISFGAEKPVVRKNVWGAITGKHLNWIDGGLDSAALARLNEAEFEQAVQERAEGAGL